MISPEAYVAQFEGRSYSELIAARDALVADLREQEAALRSPSADECVTRCPSPGVVYATSLECLAALCSHMARHAHAFTGEPDLCAIAEGEGHDGE